MMGRKRKTRERPREASGRGVTDAAGTEDPDVRSRIMRSVRRERTDPEEAVAAALRRAGVRFRRNVRTLPGSPDLANKARRFAIYVHGCFWHRHPGCSKATMPKANAEFWRRKFDANVERDARKEQALRSLGYEVEVIWECETKDPDELDRRVARMFG